MNEVFSAARDATISSYNKYRHFYDRKASALPLKKHQYCLLLNPKLTTVNDPMGKSLTKWLPLYRVETVLTNSNYIVRKVGTNNTQCVHRIRLRPIKPQYEIEDLPVINANNFTPDPITNTFSEPSLFDNFLPDLLTDRTFTSSPNPQEQPAVLFCYAPRRPVPPPLAPVPRPPISPPLHQELQFFHTEENIQDILCAPTLAPPPLAPPATYTVATVPSVTAPTYSTFMTTATPIITSHLDPRVYPSSVSFNSSSSFSGFSDSFNEHAQPILDPPHPPKPSLIPGPSSQTLSHIPHRSLPSPSYHRHSFSRIPRPITPTSRGRSTPPLAPQAMPMPPSYNSHTSTPIHSSQTSTVISSAHDTSDAFSTTPPPLQPASMGPSTSTPSDSSHTPPMPDLYDPYGHIVSSSDTLRDRIRRFNRLEYLREQEASRLKAEAAALRNPLASRDPRLRPKPKKTGFFSAKPWK